MSIFYGKKLYYELRNDVGTNSITSCEKKRTILTTYFLQDWFNWQEQHWLKYLRLRTLYILVLLEQNRMLYVGLRQCFLREDLIKTSRAFRLVSPFKWKKTSSEVSGKFGPIFIPISPPSFTTTAVSWGRPLPCRRCELTSSEGIHVHGFLARRGVKKKKRKKIPTTSRLLFSKNSTFLKFSRGGRC